jgi:putative copper export protein
MLNFIIFLHFIAISFTFGSLFFQVFYLQRKNVRVSVTTRRQTQKINWKPLEPPKEYE